MNKLILFLLLLYPIAFYGQDDSGSNVGSIGGTINVSVLGGAVYSVPLELPQGVNGMQPEICVVYNSQGGNGLLGYGWNINGISTITRTGSTLYHDGKMTGADLSGDDKFLLDGQRLIYVGMNGNTYEYKTENDEFSKVSIIKENGYISKCEVRLENGNIIKYGYTASSKLMASDGHSVIKWMVSSIEDRNGNTISYSYTTFGANSDLYIDEIAYTSNSAAGLNAQFTVSFSYSSTDRFDDYHYYIAGNKVRCSRLLTGIDIYNNSNSIISYGFAYDGNTGRMYNLLTEISLSKGDNSVYPTVIQWNTDNTDIQNNTLYSHEISQSVLDKFSFVGDFNGDGYSDLLTVPYKPYSGSVNANVYLNNKHGVFSTTPSCVLAVPDSLEWLHVTDMNGDGYDDIVVQTMTSTGSNNNYNYHTSFTVLESQQGASFDSVFSVSDNNKILIKAGDFFGEGRCGLLALRIEGYNNDPNYDILNGKPFTIHYDGEYSCDTVNESMFYEGIILSDDFNGDGKTELMILDTDYRITFSFSKQNSVYSASSFSEAFATYTNSSFFTGDFNGDGKADIIYNNGSSKYVILSTGNGFTNAIHISGTDIGDVLFPTMSLYNYSLSNVSSNTQFGINFTDLDGDGKTDVLYYNGNNEPVFFRDFKITNGNNPSASFNVVYEASNTDIQFRNQYFTMGNFLGEDHVSFVAIDPQNPSVTTDDKVKVFSFPSVNRRFTVSSITDGMGIQTDLEYDYLMPGQSDFYSFANRAYTNDVKPCPMPLVAMKSHTKHLGSNNYKTKYKYGNALIHRTGRGFVNFEHVEKTSYVNNIPVKQEKSVFETATMGINALALPLCDSTFVYNGSNRILSETNAYTFQAVRCSRQSTTAGTRLIARPAMLSKKTKTFNLDSPGNILSVGIEEYYYNYQNGGTYYNTYACNEIHSGVNGTDCSSASDCGYQNNTQLSYTSNNFSSWVVNKKSSEVFVARYLTQPAVSKTTTYTYTANNPFLISSKTVNPSQSGNNPLIIRHDYLYDACGNVLTETTSAPYGTHNEAALVTSYTYSNRRLLASKTADPNGLAYLEQYTYDEYDRVTSHTGSNGLTTTYTYSNNFGTHVVTTTPDNVNTTEKLMWAQSSTWTPTGAVYYKSVDHSGGPMTRTYYDMGGNAIRTLTEHSGSGPETVDIQYNDRGLPTQQSSPYIFNDTPVWTTFQYDGLGRLTSTTTPDGTVVSNVYNGLTKSTTTSSGNSSRTVTQTTNYLGWATCNVDASQAQVSYTYFSDGKIASMVTSGGDVTISMQYDDAGNRTLLNDPDYGQTTSVYDAYGRLIRQTTPKNDRFDYTYDVLGRITQKTSLSDATTTQYLYNEGAHKGTLASVIHTGQTLQYTYDSYDRLTTVTETRGNSTYTTSYEYNNYSRVKSKTYPSGYKVDYTFYSDGSKKSVKNIYGNELWKTDRTNASRQLVKATTGNGAVTNNTYDAQTNRLIGSATSNGIQNFAYTFDGFGNLTSRTDSIGTIKTESFAYDNLDRLTGITLGNVTSYTVYDSYGRMTSKQKDGSTVFSATQFGTDKPHAARIVRTTSDEFPARQSIEYNSLDKVKRLVQGSKVATFTYGYDGQRMRMTVTDTVTGRTKTKVYVDNCEFVSDNGTDKVYTYLMGPYGVFAVVISSGGNNAVNYVYKDHLGSWTTVTDSVGNIVERRSFDAWGNLRNASTWTGNIGRLPKFDRGFTGHEHLFDFGLINMNGRMYDPLLSSFLSPDNYMQDPTTQQGFNRYAYCMYNPLKYVDPTGEQYFGWDPGMMNRIEQEAKRIVRQCWQVVYDDISMSHAMTVALANSIYSQGDNNIGNGGSGNHGSGGGSVEVQSMGDGKYKVVKGLYDGGNTVYVVDDQGNRTGEILGYTLTSWTFYKENGILVENVTINIYDSYGQEYLDDFIDNTPAFFDYFFSDNTGFRGGYYDFKARDSNKGSNYGMMVDFGFGRYITTSRDLGNFTAGYLGGVYGLSHNIVRFGMDMYQYITNHTIEPPVSSIPQDIGYTYGRQHCLSFMLKNLLNYFKP